MNIFGFNKVLYKGNVNIDFYLYCLRKDIKLIRFLFINIWYFILSCLVYSKKDIYVIRKYRYLKYVKDLNKEISRFYKKERLNDYFDISKDIVIDRVPSIFMKNIMKNSKIVGYEFDSNFDIDIVKFHKDVLKFNKCENLFVRNSYSFENIYFSKMFVVCNNRVKYLSCRRHINSEIKSKIN